LAEGSEGIAFLKAIGNLWENKGTIYASSSFNSDPFIISKMMLNGNVVPIVAINEKPLIQGGTQNSLGDTEHNYENTSCNGFIKLNKGEIIDFGNTNGNIKLNQNGINEIK